VVFNARALRVFVTAALCSGYLVATGASRHDQPHLLVANTTGSNIVAYSQSGGRYLGEFISAGAGGLTDPDSMVIGPDGMLYISSGVSLEGSAILRFDPDTGAFLGRFAGGNGMRRPYAIAFGPDGLLYVASFRSDQILRFDGTTGAFVDAFAVGSGQPGGLNGPTGMTFGPDGALYVSTQGSVADGVGGIDYPGLPSEVLRFDIATGTSSVFVEQPDASAVDSGRVSFLGVVFGPNCDRALPGHCDLFVSDFAGDIRRYSRDGSLRAVMSTNYTGTAPGNQAVGGLTFGRGNTLFSVAFNRVDADAPGAILRYNGETNAPRPARGLTGATYIAETSTLQRPIGILAR